MVHKNESQITPWRGLSVFNHHYVIVRGHDTTRIYSVRDRLSYLFFTKYSFTQKYSFFALLNMVSPSFSFSLPLILILTAPKGCSRSVQMAKQKVSQNECVFPDLK
jgi:hypothetical protein